MRFGFHTKVCSMADEMKTYYAHDLLAKYLEVACWFHLFLRCRT